MKCVLSLFLGLCFSCAVFAADSLFTYILDDTNEEWVNLGGDLKVFLDEEGRYTIEEILRSPEVSFARPDMEQGFEQPLSVWGRIKLVNNDTKARNEYLSFCSDADTVWMYTVEAGRVLGQSMTGAGFKLSEKEIPSTANHLWVGMEAGQSKMIYFKMQFEKPIEAFHLMHLYLRPNHVLINDLAPKYAWQSLYAGMMTLFALFGLFMFGMFREKVFIYFALLMFSFILYFLFTYHVDGFLLDYVFKVDYLIKQRIVISCIIVSGFFFITSYTRMGQYFPKYYRLYLYFSFFAAAFSHLLRLVTQNEFIIVATNNTTLLIWIIMTLIPVVLLARRKNKPAQNLLTSIIVLILTALLFIIGLFFIKPLPGWLIYSFQIGTILFSAILFYGLFDKINMIRAETQRFEAMDTLKSRFFANISHEFRTPLTLVMGPLQQMLNKTKDPADRNLLQMARRNAQRLLQLINQLLDLSKLEAGKMELQVREQNFAGLLKGIVMSFESLAMKKNIRLHFVTQKEAIPLYVDKDKVEKVFYNLLSNAFKFTQEYGEISVMITEQEKQVEILVRDNGIGIAAERLSNIFDRFFQVDSTEIRDQEGTGIGLALVKELVQLHHGNIRVESEEHKGSTFTILIPKGKEHFQEGDIIETAALENKEANTEWFDPLLEDDLEQLENGVGLQNEDNQTLPVVLIIEDNTDVRVYIKQFLGASFQIIEAVNGQEGIDKALEHLPDLVISDVMMPQKNGYEVCEALKTDPRSSHIPVILLTAKAAQEEKMKGLETGADDYLIKPFDSRELEARVRNLIGLREKLRQRFSEASRIEPKEVSTNSVDTAFFEKVNAILKTNLSNEQFSVEILAQEVGMSRVHLNRKLKALTNQSANKLIQSYRLQQALELLQQKAGNVSEIAFETGFSSTAYFVKCFREKYGKTPGTVLQE